MLRPAELVTLLINTANAVAKTDFSNAANRRAYMQIERQFTQALPMSIKKFMVSTIESTPFDNEEVKIMGDSYKLKELVNNMQYGGNVKRMQVGGVPQQPTPVSLPPAPPAPSAPPAPLEVNDPQAPTSPNGAAADTVETKLREGDFVLNSTSIEVAGEQDVRKMINEAVQVAERSGKFSVPQGATSDELVDVLLGDGEIVIPKELVEVIGLDRLTKINNRGKALMEQRAARSEGTQ